MHHEPFSQVLYEFRLLSGMKSILRVAERTRDVQVAGTVVMKALRPASGIGLASAELATVARNGGSPVEVLVISSRYGRSNLIPEGTLAQAPISTAATAEATAPLLAGLERGRPLDEPGAGRSR
jgi:hypothetical protein